MDKFKHFRLSLAIDAVRQAAFLCEHVRGTLSATETQSKADKSPVTVADYGAQALILEKLKAGDPDTPAVAEEDADSLRSPDTAALAQRIQQEVERIVPGFSQAAILDAIDRGNDTGSPEGAFWTLDPIDGTQGFLRQDQYAIALALIENGKPVLGVLGCPALPGPSGRTGCIVAACRGAGVRIYTLEGEDYTSVKVSATASPEDARLCESVESGHSRHDWAAAVSKHLGLSLPSVRMDSQCKYAAVARGEADIYLRLPTRPGYEEKIWDHAAGALIVEEAGGTVTDIDGQKLDFGAGRTLRHNQGIIASNGRWHEQIVSAVGAEAPDQA
ncbi:MAG: 3'(2'),5'-bisphosphate nucleotidase [Puniceicoccales bacterium]